MTEIVIILILILLNGVLSMSEIAVISARKSSLQSDANKGSRAARKALRLQENPDKFLSSIQVGITLIGLLTGMFSGNRIAADFAGILANLGLEEGLAFATAQTIIIVVVTYVTIVIGELVPKRIGLGVAEKVAQAVAGPMIMISRLATPVVFVLSRSTSAIVKLLGLNSQESKVTEEEIKSIIQEGAEDGEVLPVEQDIVGRVFTLGDLSVDSIMTLRSDIIWLEKGMTEAEIWKIVEGSMFAEYPVAVGNLDHVVGIMTLKDFVVNSGKEDFSLEKILTKPLFFHENMNVYKVLEGMKAKRRSRALVCDEFGSCCGVITHKDILEALIGNIDDDVDDEPEIKELPESGGWIVDGQCMIYDFLRYFDMDEEMQDYEYTTVAGLIIDTLEYIPEKGESIEWSNFSFEVCETEGPRICKVIVKKIEETDNKEINNIN